MSRDAQRPHEPHELAVLGTMLLYPERAAEIADVVGEADFGLARCRAVFRAIVAVMARREPVDVVTVEAQLSRSGDLALVGGLAGLGELTDRHVTGPGVQHHLHHARQVRCYAAVRELGARASDVSQDCRELKSDPRTILDRAQEALTPAMALDAEIEPMNAVIHRTFRQIVKRRDGISGALTGLVDLDDLMLGLDPGGLYVIGARPGMGKTALATSILRWNARRETPAGILTLEMPAEQLTERMLCADAGVDNQVVRRGSASADEIRRLVRAAERLNQIPLDVMSDSAPTMAQIRSRARSWRRRYAQHDRPILAIDYLGRARGEGDTSEERIASISSGCADLAQELRCPVLLLAQLNRAVEGRTERRPRLSDLRGSGAIEQDATGILFVYRGALAGDDAMAKDEADLILDKHRHGPTGTVRVRYIGPRTLFCNVRRGQGEDEGP